MTNSRGVKVTGKKQEQLLFRKHSMFPGGLKETPYKNMMAKNPDHVRSISLPSGFGLYDLVAFWRTGHTTCGVGDVTQEQVTRTTVRPPENISFGKYGHLGHEYHAELGRWDVAFGF